MQRNTFSIHDTFDTKVALSGFYLWLLFGFLNHSVSCDLQRLMQRNLIFRHIVSIVSFFLLFTVIDTSNKAPVYLLLLKTLFIYFLFLLMMKSKYYISLPVLGLIVIDQIFKAHINYLTSVQNSEKDILLWNQRRDMLNYYIIGLIIFGFLHYAYRQYNEFGENFSIVKLVFDYQCVL